MFIPFIFLSMVLAQSVQIQNNLGIKFVQNYEIKMREIGNSNILQNQCKIFDKEFLSVPKIIIGIKLYNNHRSLKQTNFYVEAQPYTDKCNLNLVFTDKPDILYSLTISLLAIDTTYLPNLFISDLQKKTLNDFTILQNSDITYKILYQYQLAKEQQQVRKIALFLNGFKCQTTNQQQKLNFNLSYEEIDNYSFNVIITQTTDSQQIQVVYFQYIEYIENTDSSFFVEIFDDKESINKQIVRSQPYQIQNQFTLSTPNIQNSNIYSVFLGMNTFKFDYRSQEDCRQKIQITNFSSNQIDFQYVVWDNSSAYGFSSSLVIIGMKTCQTLFYSYQGQCFSSCQLSNQIDFYGTSMCICKNEDYFYINEVTQKQGQDGYLCKVNPLDTKCYFCNKCEIQNCKKCLTALDKCDICISPNYTYNNSCYIDKPIGTYCDTEKICTSCFLENCDDCTSPLQPEQKCYKCKSGYYLLDYSCFESKPSNTYCDLNLSCQGCIIQNCLDCSDPIIQPQKCNQCQNPYFKFNDRCIDKRPDNTYCNEQNECEQCQLEGCQICTDPNLSSPKCQTCSYEYFLFQDLCFQTQPPNTYCDQNICKLCINGCSQCSNPDDQSNYRCSACMQGYVLYNNSCYQQDQQPINTYCDKQTQICQDCIFKGCKSCEQNLIDCRECREGLKFDSEEKRCTCSDNSKYYDIDTKDCSKACEFPCTECYESSNNCIKCGEGARLKQVEQNNLTCECSSLDYHLNNQKNCIICDSSQKAVFDNQGKMICQCIQQGFYLDDKQKQCLKCNIKNCSICNTDGESCQQCESGFKHNINIQIGIYRQCQFCTNSVYADQQGVCQSNLKCKEGCLLCVDSTTCYLYEVNHIFRDQECHYSCSECLGQGEYECVTCSSITREFNALSNSCVCKQGYKENGQGGKDCIVDKSLIYESSTVSNRQRMMNAVYLLFLPQLFVNIHPFADMFIYSIQTLGNSSLLTSDRDPLEQLTIFNFFNLLYSNQSINTQENQFQALFLSYKTTIDEEVSYNLMILSSFYFLGMFFSIIALLLRYTSQTTLTRFQQLFSWNFQLKIIRISSNYLLLNAIVHFKNLSEASVFSNILITVLLLIYSLNLIIQIKKSKAKDQHYFSYLYENLNYQIAFHKYFWTFIEIVKIISVILMGLINPQFHKYITIAISAVLIIIFINQKPGLNLTRDALFLVLNQIFIISISSLSIVAEKQYENNDLSSLESLRNMIDSMIFVFGLFQYLFTIEYLIRWWRLKRLQIKNNCLNKLQAPIFLQMPEIISYSNIEDILNNSTMEQFPKFSFISKNKKL